MFVSVAGTATLGCLAVAGTATFLAVSGQLSAISQYGA
jgi:hypothetical protein